MGRTVEDCSDEDLLLSTCEHVGMMATLRWTIDRTRDWNDLALMDVPEHPF
jgi:hypothetical protein